MRTFLRALVATCVLAFPLLASAASLTWTGAADDLWSNAANWSPAAVPQSGDALDFPSGAPLSMTNDLPATFVPGPITMAGNYTIGGNTLHLQGLLNGSGSAILTLDCPVQLEGRTDIGGINIIANGAFDPNGFMITGGYAITFNDSLAGSGTVDINQVTLNGTNTFVGQVSAYTVEVHGSSPGASIAGLIRGSGAIGDADSKGIEVVRPNPSTPDSLQTGNLSLGGRVVQSSWVEGNLSLTLDAAGTSDVVSVHGTVSLLGAAALNPTVHGAPPAGTIYTLIANDGSDPVSGSFYKRGCYPYCNIWYPYKEGDVINVGTTGFRLSYAGGDGNDVTFTSLGPATTIALAVSPAAPAAGDNMTLTANLTSASGGTPEGTITFSDTNSIYPNPPTSKVLGTMQVSGGTAAVSFPAEEGGHVFRADFQGTGGFADSFGDTVVFISKPDPPQPQPDHMNAHVEPPSAVYGQPVTFTVSVIPDNSATTSVPTGSIYVDTNGTTYPLANGVAVFTLQLPVGVRDVNYLYSGDGVFARSSGGVRYTVDKASTSLSVSSSRATAAAGQGITLTTAILPVAPGSGTPTGTLTVSDGSQVIASAPVSEGGTAMTITLTGEGAHTLTIVYGGDASFVGSSAVKAIEIGRLAVDADNATVMEGDGGSHDVHIPLTLSAAQDQPLTVSYRTEDGSARSGTDYAATSGSVTFARGEVSKDVSVTIFGDTDPESDETFSLVIVPPASYVVTHGVTVTIQNDDAAFSRTSAIYAVADGMALTLDLLAPAQPRAGMPAVVAFIDASDESIVSRETLRGYVVAVVSVRPTFPGNIKDAKAAIRWLRANAATYGIDPARIGAWGMGTGGTLAALLGTTDGVATLDDPAEGSREQSSSVAAFVDWYGVTDFVQLAANPPACASPATYMTTLGCDPRTCPDTANAASPIGYASAGDAAALIVHGVSDCEVPLSQSERLRDALRAAGVTAGFVVVNGVHGGPAFTDESLLRQVDAFLDAYLRGATRHRPAAH